jgi:hypothetical protein
LLGQSAESVSVLDLWCGVRPSSITQYRVFDEVDGNLTIFLKAEIRARQKFRSEHLEQLVSSGRHRGQGPCA